MSLTEVLSTHGLGRLAAFAGVLTLFVLLGALRAPLLAAVRGVETAMGRLDAAIADRAQQPAAGTTTTFGGAA